MNIRYIVALALLSLLGVSANAGAQGGGKLFAQGYMHEGKNGVVAVSLNFRFRLGGASDGIYPAKEEVNIEMWGELNPDGSESSTFAIHLPIGSFQQGVFGSFYAVDPDGLEVSQIYDEPVHSFTDTGGVLSFVAIIDPPRGKGFGWMNIWMSIRDTRTSLFSPEPAPKFLELMLAGPSISIGEDNEARDEWETQVVRAGFKAKPYYPPD